ncbi:MAG TPA: carboxymuconolactone decarboxylase family protein [Burkholderiales bacterium]|jgi:4-carboxymuconolactone decarboxylase|nr:carboxymuconolactone decarboxylase family protein [Burkholderiales bacterium]
MKSIRLILMFSFVLAGCAASGPQRDETSGGSAMTALPKDIYPESRSRLPLPKREALDEQGKRVYDSVLDPKRPTIAGFQGPAGIWLHSPRVGEPIREMNRILRTEVPLEPRLRELAILVTARELDSQFEWTAHEPVALKEGLDPKILDMVKFRRPVSGAPEKETAIVGYGRELFRDRKVRPETYAEMVRVFGQSSVVNITALMANYALTAVMLTAFDQQLHEGRKPLLPLP